MITPRVSLLLLKCTTSKTSLVRLAMSTANMIPLCSRNSTTTTGPMTSRAVLPSHLLQSPRTRISPNCMRLHLTRRYPEHSLTLLSPLHLGSTSPLCRMQLRATTLRTTTFTLSHLGRRKLSDLLIRRYRPNLLGLTIPHYPKYRILTTFLPFPLSDVLESCDRDRQPDPKGDR